MGHIIKCSDDSLKKCKETFKCKGVSISKIVNSAKLLLELVPVETIIDKCLYNPDNERLYNVLLFLIRENCKDEGILKEVDKFTFIK